MDELSNKVKTGLGICRDQMNPAGYRLTSCDVCPYKDAEYGCVKTLVSDTLSLLIKQEAKIAELLEAQKYMKPVRKTAHGQGYDDVWYECGKCGILFRECPPDGTICKKCGSIVKREGK